jgi:hypothetical protein
MAAARSRWGSADLCRGRAALGQGRLSIAGLQGTRIPSTVIPRACGVSSTPPLLGFFTDVSGILDHPHARVMTAGGVAHSIASHTTLRSRGTTRPSFAKVIPLNRGSRECRMRAAPAVSCANLCEETHTSIQVQRRQSGIPCAMALRLMPRSPRRRIRLVTVIGELAVLRGPGWAFKTSADLTSATGARTTRFCRTL